MKVTQVMTEEVALIQELTEGLYAAWDNKLDDRKIFKLWLKANDYLSDKGVYKWVPKQKSV